MSDLRSKGHGFDSWSARGCGITVGKLFTPLRLCHQAEYVAADQRAVALSGWEGNRRFCIALAMRYSGITIYRLIS